MISLRIILRAYKLKRAVKRLKRAKENALRIHHGKRPRYPWYEELWTWFLECLKNNFCKTFCPCCLHPQMRKEDGVNTESFFRRPCLAGSFENLTLRSFFGFLFGLLLTTAIFFFLLYQLNCSPRITTFICCVLGVILTNALAFKPEVRCIVLLALPSLFSSRGRTVLIAYTYILVMSGPAKNALRNANILVNTLNCGQEIVIKQTKAIMKSIFPPFDRMPKNSIFQLQYSVNAIKVVFQWLQSIVEVCTSKYGSPYQRCTKAFDDAIEDCEKKMGAFKFLCYIVSAIKFVCEIARIVDLLCLISKAIKIGIIEPLKEQFKNFARQMYNEFYVNVTFVHYYNYSLEQSKSFQEIRGDIQEEIKHRMDWLTAFIDWTNLGMAFFFLLLIFNACVYRIRYLTADHFDNVYITFHVRDIDERRAAMDKETILPLTVRERRRYVSTFSLRMAASERRKLMVAGSLLLLSALHAGIAMLLDYSLYQLLKMMNFYGHLEAKTQLPTVIQIQVKGKGVMADMYRQMVTQFDPLMKSTPDFDFSDCLPNPVPLDLEKYQLIGKSLPYFEFRKA
ncbi:DC-STAMP domain-containing protein 2 [Argiope bruennichi]|uniref:DC-STAMP domain-containing protein 2 n=1 Tax=Argiope bruennichi TaxID=94029 RepID=A0A8T0G1N1_ARGBR|nr:DC-STAMP domain-containing protein 2 [Argiope bruennichi]